MLTQETCEACRADAPKVSSDELAELLKEIPEWEVLSVEGVDQLVRSFTFPNFIDAMAFANRVGELAEAMGHHPEMTVGWGEVTVRWWSHKIQGLHRNDFICAANTDTRV